MQRYLDVEAYDRQKRRSHKARITLAWFVVCLMVGVIYSLLVCAYYVFNIKLFESDAWFFGTLGACSVILVFPAVCGINTMASKLYRGEECYLGCMFSEYKNLPRTWLVMLIGWIPELLCAAVIVGAWRLWCELIQFWLVRHYIWLRIGILLGVLTLAAILVFAALMLALRFLLLWAYAFGGNMSLGQAIVRSFSCSSGRMRRLAAFLLKYLGWLVLDCLSIGVLFLLHTAPQFTFDYIKIADTLLEREQDHE